MFRRRSAEPWYQEAWAAVQAAEAGDETEQTRRQYMPFFYGRWDEAARAHMEVGRSERAAPVQANFTTAGTLSPSAIRAAMAKVTAPVLVYAGGLDFGPPPDLAAQAAALFPDGRLVVQPGAGHFPWLDDPAWFSAALRSFLG